MGSLMDDLVQWLRAQLDKDADAAQRAFSGQADPENGWGTYRPEGQPHTTITPHVGVIHEAVQADHVVAWNPARVLREIDAKRRIVDRYAWLREHGDTGGTVWVLQTLALPYADRPGYQESWRP